MAMKINDSTIIAFSLFLLRTIAMRQWTLPLNGERFAGEFDVATARYKLPTNLLARMAYQESRFRNDIITGKKVSSAGAVGLMQIVPKWHPGVDPLNPLESIDYAGKYIRELYNRFGSWKYALAAYNWGPTNLAKYLKDPINISIPKETDNYVREISADVGL